MSTIIKIFDTTLRDGEQSPGASMNTAEKIEIARQLVRLGVDVIEAGFPISSPGDFESVRKIGDEVGEAAVVCGLSRAVAKDIEVAADALKTAKRPRIHTGIGVSESHLKHKLKISRDEAIERAVTAVKLARSFVGDVEFYAEDAGRAEPAFLYRMVESVVKAGATVVNIPDTTGYTYPEEYGALIKGIRENVPGIEKVTISVHCHNDLGMAVANSLAAVMIGGARQIECTVNGLGERAGNTSLEEVVMAVRTRSDFFHLGTRLDTTQIVPTSRLVSQITGFVVQPNKAVVGANAFAHASGIHQDGVLKARQTYEIMTAEDVGWTTNKIVLGKLSGRNAFKQRLKEIGIELDSEDAYNKAFQRFKDLADKKADIFDEDLQALVAQEAGMANEEHWALVTMSQASGMGERPHATVVLSEAGKERKAEAQGDGPVDATFKAIESVAKSGAELLLYSVNAVTQGTESQGEVTVRLAKGGRVVNGVGADTDVIVASAKAYVSALNRLSSKMERLNPQHQL